MHPSLYQLTCGNLDPDVPQIIFASGVGIIMIVFAQYGVGMGICLNFNKTGTIPLDLLTLDLPFLFHFFHIRFSPFKLVTCATEGFMG